MICVSSSRQPIYFRSYVSDIAPFDMRLKGETLSHPEAVVGGLPADVSVGSCPDRCDQPQSTRGGCAKVPSTVRGDHRFLTVHSSYLNVDTA
jgi:hypothetical protein